MSGITKRELMLIGIAIVVECLSFYMGHEIGYESGRLQGVRDLGEAILRRSL